MLRLTSLQRPRILVFGNMKGGSGKSTLSMHVAIGLLKIGHRVATLDLDFDQETLTHYIGNRRAFAKQNGLVLDSPTHYRLNEGPSGMRARSAETVRLDFVSRAIAAAEPHHDFLILDTPSGINKPNLFAHALADIVVTPINDSFLDLDVILPSTDEVRDTTRSPYTDTIQQAREARQTVTSRPMDWLVLRNRFSPLESRNERAVRDAIEEGVEHLGFRTGAGIAERVIYREYFPKGLTAFDSMEASLLGVKPAPSHLAARQEVRQLIATIQRTPGEKNERRTPRPGIRLAPAA